MKYDCVIIGAGAAGLMAANELSRVLQHVLLLEAQERPGGRIYTFNNNFSHCTALGAEFIHGDLPLTTSLLRSANIPYSAMKGEMYQLTDGNVQKTNFFDEEWQQLTDELKKLQSDISFEEFLNTTFPGEKHAALNRKIRRFVEGYNAADITKVSALALREEWTQDDEPVQYRPDGGYAQLIDYLSKQNLKQRLTIKFNASVVNIDWKTGEVQIKTEEGEVYQASKVLITVPLGILQSQKINFCPDIPDYFISCKKIGFGPVIKFHFEFTESFWRNRVNIRFPGFKFIFSDSLIPTWWSQLPDHVPVLTGWLGGPSVEKINNNDEYLASIAMNSVAYVLNCPIDTIGQELKASHIKNWKTDPFTCGAYSYTTVETHSARKILNNPIEHTLYFAGEALYDGPHTGTVEAALVSGKEAARRIITSLH